MSLTTHSHKRNRVYKRKFDHDEARAVYARGGVSVNALAERYGVSYQGMKRVLDPATNARMKEHFRKWGMTTCEHCGEPCWRIVAGKAAHNPDGRILCQPCRAVLRRERLRFDDLGQLAAVRCIMLDCANGQRWQAPEYFSRGSRHREVRPGGIHQLCRACQTRMRARSRERSKVPCSNCGAPRHPSDGRRRDTGLCRPCYHASLSA